MSSEIWVEQVFLEVFLDGRLGFVQGQAVHVDAIVYPQADRPIRPDQVFPANLLNGLVG